jgi:hypothetical protein
MTYFEEEHIKNLNTLADELDRKVDDFGNAVDSFVSIYETCSAKEAMESSEKLVIITAELKKKVEFLIEKRGNTKSLSMWLEKLKNTNEMIKKLLEKFK